MLLIQVVAALLLLAGSAVVFKALLEVDAPTPRRRSAYPRRVVRVAPAVHERDDVLGRAA